jgi:hypothetical protein
MDGAGGDERTASTVGRDADGLSSAAVQFVTAEHFGLQGARTTTIIETNGRHHSYLSLLSAVIVALAFIGQVTGFGSAFFAFTLVLLPLVYYVGLTTIGRVHQLWAEWFLYQVGMNRLRRLYLETEPGLEPYFVMLTTDDPTTSLASIGISPSPWQWTVGVAGSIGVVNSVVAGVQVGFVVHQAAEPAAAVSWLCGGMGFILSAVLLHVVMLRRRRRIETELLSNIRNPIDGT